ncbi:MAG: hypothetical protein IH951_10945 [Bacteroidetes bacterium]|nr:hypothetical protein [Bacteroidota bacterium]
MKRIITLIILVPCMTVISFAQDDGPTAEEMIADALTAAIPSIANDATVMDWEGNMLREGTNGWTCMPTPPDRAGPEAMCLDNEWIAWASAWQGHTEPPVPSTIGFGYMLAGAGAESNTDPYAEGPTDDNEWMESQPPHIMLLVPDASALEGLPTAFGNGGPWVMWAGTSYVHVMIPTE